MQASVFFGTKTFRFFKIYGVSSRIRREESIFHNFVRTSFMDGLLRDFVRRLCETLCEKSRKDTKLLVCPHGQEGKESIFR